MLYKNNKIGSQSQEIEYLPKIKNYAKKIGVKVKDELEFYASAFKDAVKEAAESQGIPTERSYWKEHKKDAALTTASAIVGGALLGLNLDVVFDEKTRLDLLHGTVTEGVKLFPTPQKYSNPNYPNNYIPSKRSLMWNDYAGLLSPALFFGLGLVVEGVRYHNWKKTIEKSAKQASKN